MIDAAIVVKAPSRLGEATPYSDGIDDTLDLSSWVSWAGDDGDVSIQCGRCGQQLMRLRQPAPNVRQRSTNDGTHTTNGAKFGALRMTCRRCRMTHVTKATTLVRLVNAAVRTGRTRVIFGHGRYQRDNG